MRFFPKLKNLILRSSYIQINFVFKIFFFFNYLFQLQASINQLTPSTLETVNIATVHNGFLYRVFPENGSLGYLCTVGEKDGVH